ncbi:uncharacterized protein BDR25DRAFT_350100 [Lindgomyces ingoldianus]|uniref:Uncharacterized protein n=1 Tax=Lindgomyces ingoldianus TaxID=673940 RepID=A0ACB6R915_9PLEO|nr:uncharacterized protein BDR25DRAFT_350100 [Lindgomyces ingoldianus]KAF2475819.1 hypothetical protein BDR25DRAFT_350100 [Lindgomyces ingoldianus]
MSMRLASENSACIVDIYERDEMFPGCRVPSKSLIWPTRGNRALRALVTYTPFSHCCLATPHAALHMLFRYIGCSLMAEEGSYGKRVDKVVRSKQMNSAVHGYDIA